MKKRIALLLAGVLALSVLAGCQKPAASEDNQTAESEDSQPAESTDSGEEPAAGGVAPEEGSAVYISRSMEDSFGALLAYALQDAFEEKHPGWSFSIQDSDNDASKQLEFMENAIAAGVDVMIVQSVADANCLSTAQEAIDEGILVMCYEVPFEEGNDICPLVYSDFYTTYRVLMDYAEENVPENANAVVLSGIEGFAPCVSREDALNEFLEARSDVNVLAYQYANYNTDEAMNIMEDWLQQYDNIDAVICLTDTMAIGAIEAYRANNIDCTDVWICGVDSLLDACGYIQNGELTASVFRPPVSFADAAMGVIDNFYAGTQDMTERIALNSDLVVTKENVEEIIAMQQ